MGKTKFLTSLLLILLLSCVNAQTSEPTQPETSKHFVLVHGACLGAWSWYRIVPLLESSGHNVTAIDLGASGDNPKQVLQVPHLDDYFDPLTVFMASLPAGKKVVLVGHSLGGLAISKAMESFPKNILVAVFLNALMPAPILNDAGLLFAEAAALPLITFDNQVNVTVTILNIAKTFIFGPKYLRSFLYPLSPIEDWERATKLVRPFYLYNLLDITKTLILTKEKYGSVKRVYVRVPKDKIITNALQQQMILTNPPDAVEEIKEADLMVMSSQPLELFALLKSIANNY